MANWYVDPDAVGANNGTSEANAWVSIVSALASASVVSGDIVWCKGTQVLSASITQVAQNSGVIFRAVNSSWIADGTRFVINANGLNYAIYWATAKTNRYEYFEIKGAVLSGVAGANTGFNTFYGCLFTLNGRGYGDSGGSIPGYFLKCSFINNTIGYGGAACNNSFLNACVFLGNTTDIIVTGANVGYNNCYFINSTNGITLTSGSISNCVFDGISGVALLTSTGVSCVAVGCRFTNCGTGARAGANSGLRIIDSYFANNTTDTSAVSGGGVVLFGETITGGTDDGYTNRATFDYSYKADAILRRTVKSAVAPTINMSYVTAGVPGADIEVRDFYLDKSVVSVTAGTVITVTLKHLAATLMTGLTLKGVACTDRTVTGANTLTFVTPTLMAGIGDIVGSFTGYDDFTISNGITAQAGASAPGTVTVTGYATGKYANLSWTMAGTSVTYDIEIDGVVYTGYTSLSAEIAMARANTEYSFRVRGVNSVGNGNWSTAITVKTEQVADDETIALAGTAVLSSVEDLTGTLHIAQGMTGAKIFDPIILPSAISQETFEYYVKDVLYNQGRNVL